MRSCVSLLLASVSCVALTGCIGPTPEQQTVSLQYEGGRFVRTAPDFSRCVIGGQRGDYDFGGTDFTYPANQRVVDFTGGTGSDRGPITIVSKDGIEMSVGGSLQYQLNTDCGGQGGVIRQFHEELGRRYAASFEQGPESIPSGWREIQRLYLETPLETAMDRAAQNYNWLDLYKNPGTKVAWENDVRRALPNEVNRSTPGEAEFYLSLEPRIGAPTPAGERGNAVKAAITAGEQRIAEAKAREAEAKANEAAARAQIAVARAQAEARRQEIAGYGTARAYNEAKAIDRGINPYQPSYGGQPLPPAAVPPAPPPVG